MTDRPWLSASRVGAIALGGALGTLGRYGLGQAFPVHAGTFPWTTLAENVAGAFLLAILVVLVVDRWAPSTFLQPFAMVGLCGGFTTYSTFAAEAAVLVRDGRGVLAFAYVVTTLVAGVGAVVAGFRTARLLEGTRP